MLVAFRSALACALFGLGAACACAQNGLAAGKAAFPPMTAGPVDEMRKPSLKELYEAQQSQGLGAGMAGGVSDETVAKLEALLAQNLYEDFDRYARKLSGDAKLTAWMSAKAEGGDVMMMWLLADRHASVKSIDLAIKWSYAALIGTMQERSLCLDDDTQFAAGKLSSDHAQLMQIGRANPFAIKDAKIFAMDTLMKAQRYPDPVAWLCKPYAEARRRSNKLASYAYEPIYHPYLRARERNRMRKALAMEQPPEVMPPLPRALPAAEQPLANPARPHEPAPKTLPGRMPTPLQ